MMKYDRKKETDPLKTVETIRSILAKLGIMTTENWKIPYDATQPDANAYSVRVDAPAYGMGTNGKGSTREYTLASAYGEFMERLQNLILLPVERLTTESLASEGFVYYPDEKMLTPEEAARSKDALSDAACRDFYRGEMLLECGVEERKRVIAAYQQTEVSKAGEKLLAFPFYSVKQNDTVYIWNRYINFLQGSNGMCAGNTPAEALVQGFSEIFERYASMQILSKHMTPPDMPREVYAQYDVITGIIQEIENMGPYRILVKDCSLGMGLPVCAIVLVDYEKQRYCVNFGAHPHVPIAVERCLTELLQGYDPANARHNEQKLISIDRSFHNAYLNVHNAHCNGKGIFDLSFFAEEASYPYTPFADLSGADNEQMLTYCIELAMKHSEDVLIRDVSYLGFPAYYIAVPGISHFPISRMIMRQDSAYVSLANLDRYRTDLDQAKLKNLLVGLNRWESSSTKIALPVSVYRLKTAVLLMLGYAEDLVKYLQYVVRECEDEDEKKELDALGRAVKYRMDGCSEKAIKKMLTLFYGEELWNTLTEKWFCDNPVEEVLKQMPEDTLTSRDHAVNELFLRLKREFAKHPVVQNDLRKVIHVQKCEKNF